MGIGSARCSRLRRLIVAWIGGLSAVCSAGAQVAHFSGAQTTVVSDTASPVGTAVDQFGNVFVLDAQDGSVYEIHAVNGEIPSTPQTTPIISGFKNPSGIAADGKGNIFVSDTGDGAVVELNPMQGTKSTLTNAIASPLTIAVDGSGDVFVVDPPGSIDEIVAVNGAIPANPAVITIANSFRTPTGLAIDSKGNLYVADSGQQSISEILAVNGVIPMNPTVVPIGANFNGAAGVAVDQDGNLYVTLMGASAVFKLMAVDGVVAASPVEIVYGSGLNNPLGLSSGGSGRVFIADLGNSRIEEVETARVSFPSGNVGSPQPPITLTFSFDFGGKLGSAPNVLTQGESGLDFTDAGTGSCTTNGTGHAYAQGDTCTVDVNFTPIRPGTRSGVVVLGDSQYFNFAHAFLEGFGVGPQVTFLPAVQKTLGSGFSGPLSVAVDARGDVFVADNQHGAVKELVAIGGVIGSTSAINTIGSGFIFPLAVAVDGGGNLYVSDGETGGVYEIYAVNGTIPPTPNIRILGAFGYPQGLAVDSSGDVYVADSGTDTGGIYKIVADDGYLYVSERASIETVLEGTIPPFYLPVSVAVDGEGNLFFVDDYREAIEEIPAQGGIIAAPPFVFTVATAPSKSPGGVALDQVGNLYFSDYGGNAVYEVPAPISSFQPLRTVASGLANPVGLAVDRKGNVYIADSGLSASAVIEEDLADVPALHFATTSAGTASADSPKTVTVENAGNAPLTFPEPGTGTNPAYPAAFPVNSKDSNLCAAGMLLQPDSGCDISANFIPGAPGPVSGKIQILDNALNVGNGTQSITVSGAGALLAQTIKFSLTGSPTYGASPIALTATASSGLSVGFDLVSGPGKIAGSVLTITGAGAITVNATQAGNTTYQAASPVQQTITVLPAALKVTVKSVSRAYGIANPGFTAVIAGLLNNDAVTLVYSTTATASSPIGPYPITALLTGPLSINYNPTIVPGTLTIVTAVPVIVWPSPAPIAAGTALSPTQLDASTSAAGAMAYSPPAGTMLSLGQHTLSVKFTPTDKVDYSGTSAQTSISVLPATAAPTFSVPGGTYTTVQSVKLEDATAGASIYYTLDGTAPTLDSVRYSTPISVGSTETIRAMAYVWGDAQSATVSATYTIHLPATARPAFSPAGGTYTSEPSVTITDTTSGATIYYTTDGATPTQQSARYSTSIVVGGSETIRAIAVALNHANSTVASAQYTLNLPATASPVFSPPAGTYEAAQSVAIKDTMSGAVIYYTADGTKPSLSSPRYTAPIHVSKGQTLSAIAAATGHQDSAVVTAKYTIGSAIKSIAISPAAPVISAGTTAQLKATATYVDGTQKDVTSLVTWSTATTLTANVTLSGVAVGNSSGITTISASLNGVVGSTQILVTIPANPNPVLTVYSNPTDSHGFSAALSDGSKIDYFGVKDSTGVMESISSVALTRPNGAATVATYNSSGLPVSVHGSGGGSLLILWTSATTGFATAVSPDGKTKVGPVPFTLPTNGANFDFKSRRPMRGFENARRRQLTHNTSGTFTPPVATVQVTDCAGEPVENATVQLFYSPPGNKPGLTIEITGQSPPGSYEFSLPVPDPIPGLTVDTVCGGLDTGVEIGCTVYEIKEKAETAIDVIVDQLAPIIDLPLLFVADEAQEIGGVIGAAQNLPVPSVCDVLTEDFATGETNFERLCKAVGNLTDESSSTPEQVTLTPLVFMPSGDAVDAPSQVVSSENPSTTFTIVANDSSDCGIVSVKVTPIAAGVQLNSTLPLKAQAYNGGGAPVAGTYTWSSKNTTIANVDPATGEVTGVSAGTTTVTATELSSGVQGNATVTVSSAGADRFLYLDLKYTGNSSTPATGTVTINGTTIAANAVSGLYKICSVPDNTTFTLDLSTNANLLDLPTVEAANLLPDETFLTSDTQSIDMQALFCGGGDCLTDAQVEQIYGSILNSCVSIPGVNE